MTGWPGGTKMTWWPICETVWQGNDFIAVRFNDMTSGGQDAIDRKSRDRTELASAC